MLWIKKYINSLYRILWYRKTRVGGNPTSAVFNELVKKNRRLLLDNHIPLKKIRFVSTPIFQYDILKDVINPEYIAYLPNTKVLKNQPDEISINKPYNLITIGLSYYYNDDDYHILKTILQNSKKGVVILINEENSVADEVFRFVSLDEELYEYQLI